MQAIPNGESGLDYSTSNVLQALELIHSSATKNEVRLEASNYLDRLKSSQQALQHGHALATDQTLQPLVRHFGLSLLEHVVKHQSHELDDSQNDQLRSCIIDLGRNISGNDPLFVRNKIAELWVELAKRSWALDWHDLDPLLCEFWEQTNIYQGFVLAVLENLSEDVFIRDDPTAIMRGKDLNAALVEIFTPKTSYPGGIKIGDTIHHMRHGDQGWLVRVARYLEQYLGGSPNNTEEKTTALKAIATLRSAFSWVMASAIEEANCLLVVCNCLTRSDEEIIMAAVDALIALYCRQALTDAEVHSLVYPLVQPGSVSILQQVYDWSIVGVEEVLSQQYAISKKLAELMSLLSDLMTRLPPPETTDLDVSAFLQFMIHVARHDSLIVSIAAIHSWERLFTMPAWRRTDVVSSCVSSLLGMVLPRLIQYDQMPDDTDEPAVVFVAEEIEIFPERQGFFLNYRRLCGSVIEWVCYVHLEQAVDFVLSQINTAMNSIKQEDGVLDLNGYRRISLRGLRAESQFSIAEAAFRGLDRYLSHSSDDTPSENVAAGERARAKCKDWALSISSELRFNDPAITQRQIKMAVEVSTKALQGDKPFAVAVLELILASFTSTRLDFPAYSDAVTELYAFNTSELRRLSITHADYFATFYDQLSTKFGDLITSLHVEPRVQTDLKSILFLIIQRASTSDSEQQRSRLWTFLEPLMLAWNDSTTQGALSNFDQYCKFQCIDRVGPFLASVNAGAIEDWTSVTTNQDGLRTQNEMTESYSKLPLRETRVLLSTSTDRLEQNSAIHQSIIDLWMPMVPQILQGILHIISFNHRLHDPSSWPNVSADLVPAIRRVLRDRYWQSGISEGSMNDFHSKVKTTKTTLEGFASSVRGRMRINLEQCYSIVHTLGRLGGQFYGLPQIPPMIAEAMISTTGPLSPHHFSILLLMLPKLIEECPPENRQQFLTPILSSLLTQINSKLSTEWQKMDQRKQNAQAGENLSEEMRDDSVLRQTTYKAVNMVATWLSPRRELELTTKKSIVNGHHLSNGASQSMADFILSNQQILEPLMMFTTQSLTFKDTKATQVMLVAAQRIVPAFAGNQNFSDEVAASIREYISDEMLKAAITAVNDGYFADYQQYYAQLIAVIWLTYGLPAHVPSTPDQPAHERPAFTETPRNLLLSLPNMTEAKVNAAAQSLLKEGIAAKPRKLRAIIMHLLEGVRGVRVSDLGKIDTKAQQSRILEKYKQRESLGMQGVQDAQRHGGEGGPDLGGVADMFGNA